MRRVRLRLLIDSCAAVSHCVLLLLATAACHCGARIAVSVWVACALWRVVMLFESSCQRWAVHVWRCRQHRAVRYLDVR